MNLPYSFGSAGGSVLTDSSGKQIACAADCGRVAVGLQYNLPMCKQCDDNVKYQENIVGSGKIPNPLSFIIANKANNLQKR
jgi:hypothetical protein